MRKPKEPVTDVDTYRCVTCKDQPEFATGPEMSAHLKTVHGVPPGTKGSKRMNTHLDCSDCYISSYDWEMGGVKFVSSHRRARKKGDMMAEA